MQFREEFDVTPTQRRRPQRVPRPGRQRARAHGHRVRARPRQRDPRSILAMAGTVDTPARRCRKQIAKRRSAGSRLPDARRRRGGDVAAGGGHPALVEDELRAFNVERIYAGDKGVTAGGDRRVGAAAADDGRPPRRRRAARREAAQAEAARQGGGRVDDGATATSGAAERLDALDDTSRSPAPSTTLVLVAADIDQRGAPARRSTSTRRSSNAGG